MGREFEVEYWVPECVREYLRGLGFVLPLEAMEAHIREWHSWMSAVGEFYDYRDTDGFGRVYEVHRRSIHPAMRVCQEWGSLLLNDKTRVICEKQECTDWVQRFFADTGFMPQAQNAVVRAFGMGTGAWALWVDADSKKVRIRHYDARMVLPLTWDEEGVSECAFVTRAFYRGKSVDQLQMHLRGGLVAPDGAEQGDTYRIITVCFDEDGNLVAPAGVCPEFDTGCPTPTFAIIKPAVDNTRVDMSPYGQSVFADAVDAIQAVDLAFDALINEVDISKMRIFLSDVMFDREEGSGKSAHVAIPFGKQDCTVFRKVMSTEDMIQDFAPALRTEDQAVAFRVALQMLGDLCGFGMSYFDFDDAGYVKTATEVSSDNSALMRSIARHEHALEASLTRICRSAMHVARGFGEALPEAGAMRVTFDDSIITDTAADKAQDMREVGVCMHAWEYRMKWYGEDEATARRNAEGLGTRAGVIPADGAAPAQAAPQDA